MDQSSALQKLEAEETTKAFRDVFNTSAGKVVLFWMLEQCAIYQDAFSGELTNATNYTLGRQGVGRRLIAQLDSVDPTMYPALLLAIADFKSKLNAAAGGADEGEEYDAEA